MVMTSPYPINNIFDNLAKLAKQGDACYQYELGELYFDGKLDKKRII